MKKKSLSSLLNDMNHFRESLDINCLNKDNLIRFYLSGYKFFRRKYNNAKSAERKIEHQKQYRNFWNLYCWKVSSSKERTTTFKNKDLYDLM